MRALQPSTWIQSPPRLQGESLKQSKTASDRISCDGQLHREFKKRGRLTDKEPVFREGLHSRYRAAILRRGRSDHGTRGQVLADETAWLRQDLVGLGQLCGRVVEIRKG